MNFKKILLSRFFAACCILLAGCGQQSRPALPLTELPRTGSDDLRSACSYRFKAADQEVLLGFVSGKEQWVLHLWQNRRKYQPLVYASQDDSMGVSRVFSADLNRDGAGDFIIELINGGFCGLNAGLSQILVILSVPDGSAVLNSFWTMNFEPEDVVQTGTGSGVVIRELIQPAEEDKDSFRRYLVSGLYEFQGTGLQRSDRDPGFANLDSEGRSLSRKQKLRRWAESAGDNRIKTVELCPVL